MKAFLKPFKSWQTHPKKRARLAKVSFSFYKLGLGLQRLSTALLRFMNPTTMDDGSDWFMRERKSLLEKIHEILLRQKREYPHYAYFYGYPYQGLAIAGVYGERLTEERFEMYNLGTLFDKDDVILDIGCNCGFVGIYTAFRLGCEVHGVDINPYMIEIGQEVAKHLRIDHKVRLTAGRFQDFKAKETYSGIFSFATHWTDDEKYRVPLKEHLLKIHGLLKPQGKLIFESHCNDVGQESFYKDLEEAKDLFDIRFLGPSDKGSREIYVMLKKDV